MMLNQKDDLTAFVVITQQCSMRCRYCFYYQRLLTHVPHTKRILAEELGSALCNLPLSNVILTGGDPLCKDAFEYSLALKKNLSAKGLHVFIDTALAISDPRKLLAVAEANFEMIYVSCDSHQPKINDQQRMHGAITLAAIKELVNHGANVSVISVITKLNYHQIREIWSYFKLLGVQAVDFNIATIPNNSEAYAALSCELLSEREKQKLTDDLMWWAAQCSKQLSRKLYAQYQVSQFFGSHIDTETFCKMGNEFIIVDTQGKVRPCFHRNEAWGNLNDSELIMQKVRQRKAVPYTCRSKSCVSLFAIESFWREHLPEGGNIQ